MGRMERYVYVPQSVLEERGWLWNLSISQKKKFEGMHVVALFMICI